MWKSSKLRKKVGAKRILGVREPLRGFKEPIEMKRLTIDVPAYLHANVKAGCARQGIKMADAIRELLEEKFGNIE